MSYFGLVLSQLFSRKTRTILTLLSLLMAFLLFGLLQAVNVAFNRGASIEGASRVVTQARVSFTQALPLRHVPLVEAVPGVEAVMYQQWFGAWYQEPRQQLVAFAVEPERLHEVVAEWQLTDDQWQAFATTRTGIIVGKQLADRFDWKVGDKLPLNSNIWPQQDGNMAWIFDIVGIFDTSDPASPPGVAYINFDYFDEARQFGKGGAGIIVSRLSNPKEAEQVSQAIDALFLNSADETKSQSEQEFNLNFVRQLGDINLIVNAILGAVFFTILLLTGNTMAQAVRERIPQLAVLKTLGFSDSAVQWLVLAETFLLIGIGALLGMCLATVFGMGLTPFLGGSGSIVDLTVWGYALIAVIVLALAVGLPPALRARRLNIVDALAGR
ncbi:MAG: FtsX-like permease family protein [Lysobacterales bacterium]